MSTARQRAAALRVFRARAMDGIPVADLESEDRHTQEVLARHGLTLVNPFVCPTQAPDDNETVQHNESLLQESDVIIVDLKRAGHLYVGTIFEMAASVRLGRPVIVYGDGRYLASRLYVRHYAEFICDDLEEAVEYVSRCCSPDGAQQQLAEMISYYDAIAPRYEQEVRSEDERRADRADDFARDRARLKARLQHYCRDRSVLELGCGDGDWTQFLTGVAADTTAIDASANMVRTAAERFANAPRCPRFVQGDVLADDPDIERCDVIICYFLLSVLPPLLQRKLLQRIKSWGSDAACFLFAEVMPGFRARRASGHGRRQLERRTTDQREFTLYKEYFSHADLRALLEDNGFSIIECPGDVACFSFCAAKL